MKQFIKKIIPSSVWTAIRRRRISEEHRRVAAICDGFISRYYSSESPLLENKAKREDLVGKKIIWQYWAQGFEDELPEVVQVCLDSVDKYKGDYEVIRLSDNNIADYIDLPAYVWEKREHGFSVTVFSDVLRLALLYCYGGVWLDATVLLTAPLPEKYSQYDYFMFQRDNREPHKEYWEHSYAYYWGWEPEFRVRVLNSIIFAKVGSRLICDSLNLLLLIWKECDTYPFYFTFQVLYNQLIVSGKAGSVCPIENDCRPHCLIQYINDEDFYMKPDEICRICSIHKLTFKELDPARFRRTIDFINDISKVPQSTCQS